MTSHEPSTPATDEAPAEQVVREMFARLSARDFDGVVDLLADDVEFDLAYAPAGYEMPVRGRDAMRALVTNVIGAMFDPFQIGVVTVYPGLDPGVLVAEYKSDATVTHNQKQYLNRYVGIFKLSGGLITFQLPRSRQLEVMRVRGDASEPLPASFYGGTNSFYGQSSSDPNGLRGPGVGPLDALVPGTPAQDTARGVVESDIWKTRGHTLYFFNQLRGLQIIDVTNPDAAVVRGTLELPAAGEALYLLGTQHVVLLARNDCSYDQSQVWIVADTNGPPTIVARLPVSGYVTESRMVGTALYVASQSYRPVANSTNSTWEWGTLVSSFDLADPNSPVARGTLWYPGYANVVTATDRLLFVVTQDASHWWQSVVRSIDITAPDGTMHAYETIRTSGRVPDKFHPGCQA